GSSAMKVCCCSGDSFRTPHPLSCIESVAKMRLFRRKSGCPMCAPSVAPARSSAWRRKSATVVGIGEQLLLAEVRIGQSCVAAQQVAEQQVSEQQVQWS